MRVPLLYNADHIANAGPPHMIKYRGVRLVCRLYGTQQPAGTERFLTRCRLAWAVFCGKYDAVAWNSDTPEDLASVPERLDAYEKEQGPLASPESGFDRRFRVVADKDSPIPPQRYLFKVPQESEPKSIPCEHYGQHGLWPCIYCRAVLGADGTWIPYWEYIERAEKAKAEK